MVDVETQIVNLADSLLAGRNPTEVVDELREFKIRDLEHLLVHEVIDHSSWLTQIWDAYPDSDEDMQYKLMDELLNELEVFESTTLF